MYIELLKRLVSAHAILSENDKTSGANLQLQFVEFNEYCLRGYASDLKPDQIQKIKDLLLEIQGMLDQRDLDPGLAAISMECFQKAIGDKEQTEGWLR